MEQLAACLRSDLARHDGLTVDLHTGQRPPSGIAVCPDRRLSRLVPWPEWDERRVGRWVAWLTAAMAPHSYLGAWLDPGLRWAWVEAVVVVPTRCRTQALHIATIAGQRAVYDLDCNQVVPVRRYGR